MIIFSSDWMPIKLSSVGLWTLISELWSLPALCEPWELFSLTHPVPTPSHYLLSIVGFYPVCVRFSNGLKKDSPDSWGSFFVELPLLWYSALHIPATSASPDPFVCVLNSEDCHTRLWSPLPALQSWAFLPPGLGRQTRAIRAHLICILFLRNQPSAASFSVSENWFWNICVYRNVTIF